MAMSFGGSNNSNAATCDAKIAGLYDLLDTLGSGHFAVVKLARHVFTGEKVAVKVIDKSKLDEVSKSHLFQEVRCMKLVQHPNVVRLYEVIDTQTKLYLILELGDGGDLYDYIMRHESGLSETLARDYFRQIVRAISYCHRLHVVHRDLKPENVVFFERLGMVKLTDFGFSNKFYPGQKLETSCGSLAYSAPEILLGDLYDAPAVDVWSLGVILFMLVCGNAPFQEANDSETLTMIMDCKYTIPGHVSSACKRLIRRMLVREPDKRATLSEIATDPWVTYGEGVSLEDFDAPLVTKEQLTDEDQSLIIQKMVSGEMGSKEEILDSIEKDDYNHITATYYLLAERRLRAKRQSESLAKRPDALNVVRVSSAKTPGTQNLLLPPQPNASARTPQDLPPRSRKCSIVREEESEEEGSGTGGSTRRPSRSEGRLHLAAAHLCKVNLKEEFVEVSPTATRIVPPPAPPPPRRQPRRRPRAGSCSSSDLSDDDSEKKKLAAAIADDIPTVRTRRDSHDDSSDGQERGPGGGGNSNRQVTPASSSGTPAGRPSTGAGGDAAGGGSNNSGGGRRRRAGRKESRLRESRSLNRIAEVEEGVARWAGAGAAALRPLLRLLAAARPQHPAPPRLRPLC